MKKPDLDTRSNTFILHTVVHRNTTEGLRWLKVFFPGCSCRRNSTAPQQNSQRDRTRVMRTARSLSIWAVTSRKPHPRYVRSFTPGSHCMCTPFTLHCSRIKGTRQIHITSNLHCVCCAWMNEWRVRTFDHLINLNFKNDLRVKYFCASVIGTNSQASIAWEFVPAVRFSSHTISQTLIELYGRCDIFQK